MSRKNFSPPRRTALRPLAVAVAVVALVLTGCSSSGDSGSSATAEADGFDSIDPINLKIATLYGPDNWQTTPMAAFTDAITEATDGKVTFEYFYAGALVPAAEMASGLRDGLVDMAHIVPVYTAAVFPYDNYINQLSFVSDPSPIAGSLQAAGATLQWGWETEEYLAEFEAEGLVPLLPRLQTVHTYGLLCNEDAGSLSSVEGKRVRAGGEAWANEVTDLGGVPVSMPSADAYTAFQQGLLDCAVSGAEDVYALGLTDHGKSWNSAGMTGWSSAGVFMSELTWQRLPLIVKQAIWEQLPVFLESFFEAQFETNLGFLEQGETTGVEFVVPDPDMKESISDYHDSVIADIASSAPAEVTDADAAVARWTELHDAWYDEVTGTLGFNAAPQSWAEYVAEYGADVPDLGDWAQAVYDEILADRLPTE